MQKTLKCLKVESGWAHKGTTNIHRITFENDDASENQLYVAEEPSSNGPSPWRINDWNTFEIKTLGRDGKRDWIKFIVSGIPPTRDDNDNPISDIPVVSRDKIECAKAGLYTATVFGKEWGLDEEGVDRLALKFARSIYEIAAAI